MGFLDKLNRAVDNIKEQVEQSVVYDRVRDVADRARTAGMPPSGPATGWAGPGSVAAGADLADRRWWPTAADVGALTGLPLGPPEYFDTPDTYGVRFAGADGRGIYTFDLHCVREDSMVAAGGQRPWIDHNASARERSRVIPGLGDYAVIAADGDSRFVCFAASGDALFYLAATSPGVDVSHAAEAILRKLYDLPA